MMRPRLDRYACLALCAGASFALTACFDAPVSLGHHEVPAPPGDGDGDGDSMMEPPAGSGGQGGQGDQGGQGGQGGQLPMPMPDSGIMMPDAEVPEPQPCDRGSFSVMLECELQGGMFGGPPGGGGPQPPMSTTSTFTIAPRTDLPQAARVTGQLDFTAWNISFAGRVDGQIDCRTGLFHAVIIDGVATMPDVPPSPFFGELDGGLDRNGALFGVWWHGPQPQDRRCIGMWSATRP